MTRAHRSGPLGAGLRPALPVPGSASDEVLRFDRADPAPIHDRCDRPVALRLRRGRPDPDADHADLRQAQGDRQGDPPADLPDRRQPRAVRGAAASLLARGRTFDVVTQVSVGHAWLNLRDSLESCGDRLVPRRAGRSDRSRSATPPSRSTRCCSRAYELLDAGMAPGSGRPLVRDAPRRRARRPARGRPLRRVRPRARGRRPLPLGSAARRRPVRPLPGSAA